MLTLLLNTFIHSDRVVVRKLLLVTSNILIGIRVINVSFNFSIPLFLLKKKSND